jgi:hypothetical protein
MAGVQKASEPGFDVATTSRPSSGLRSWASSTEQRAAGLGELVAAIAVETRQSRRRAQPSPARLELAERVLQGRAGQLVK